MELIETNPVRGEPFDFWKQPAVIAPNKFVYKSLSDWSLNVAVGCSHKCGFCYVPSASTIKLAEPLSEHGVNDPDLEWGDYALVRTWNPEKFVASMLAAERTPADRLSRDGNRAVMMCTTTDPYQVSRHPDAARRKELDDGLKQVVRESLRLLLKHSTLNVRVQTRGPLARRDFDLMKEFGNRLVFGMSLPTLDDGISKAYEPNAPGPAAKLRTLQAAKEAGLNVYVAMAPTFPECDEADMRRTLEAIKALDPVTVFHEPINIRRENALRMAQNAQERGLHINTSVFQSPVTWLPYALRQLQAVERLAGEMGIKQLHLWPDKSLGTQDVLAAVTHPGDHLVWLKKWWNRVSEWPGKGAAV